MPAWTSDGLERIGAAAELQLASVRRDSMLRRPVAMWVVGYGGDIYVRSVNGRASSWYRGVQVRREGHIRAGGVDKDVLFIETDDMNDELDAGYRAKSHRYAESIVGSIVSPEAGTATLKLVPRQRDDRENTRAHHQRLHRHKRRAERVVHRSMCTSTRP